MWIQGGRVSLDRGLSFNVVLTSSEAVVMPERGVDVKQGHTFTGGTKGSTRPCTMCMESHKCGAVNRAACTLLTARIQSHCVIHQTAIALMLSC